MREEPASSTLSSENEAADIAISGNRRLLRVFGPVAAALIILTGATVYAAYNHFDGHLYIYDRTISEYNFFEVTGFSAVGVVGGLGVVVVGLVAALVAAAVGLALAAAGLTIGAVVLVGVTTGPILLCLIIAIMIKRRYWPDVI